jgi:UDP-N-acetylglucosamine acyltransferase
VQLRASTSAFPYPLLDRVLEVQPGVRGLAAKLVSANEPYFVGHFPGAPVMPGVLLCEALAQLGAAVTGEEDATLATVERARFRRPVLPGDALRLEVQTLSAGPPARLRGTITAAETAVAEVLFTIATPRGARIHPTAVVSPHAVVGAHVVVGPETWIGPHAVVDGRTTLGARNRIFSFASVGTVPQDLKYRGEESTLVVGDDNLIREYVSMNPGTAGGGMETRVGNGCLFMVSSHVAHDCRVDDRVILANGAALGGHVTVERHAIVNGLAGVHQFVRVGESAFCAAGAMVSQDVPPYCTVAGDRARLYGLNLLGLRRRGFDTETIVALKRAYRLLFLGRSAQREALERTEAELGQVPEVARLVAFVRASERGVCRA